MPSIPTYCYRFAHLSQGDVKSQDFIKTWYIYSCVSCIAVFNPFHVFSSEWSVYLTDLLSILRSSVSLSFVGTVVVFPSLCFLQSQYSSSSDITCTRCTQQTSFAVNTRAVISFNSHKALPRVDSCAPTPFSLG